MPRIHFLQQWYALSDPAVEEALYDSPSMRRFVGIDLGRDPMGRAYNRTSHLDERRKMMQVWADYLDRLKAGGKVLLLNHKAE